jgi:hypothetical protein
MVLLTTPEDNLTTVILVITLFLFLALCFARRDDDGRR